MTKRKSTEGQTTIYKNYTENYISSNTGIHVIVLCLLSEHTLNIGDTYDRALSDLFRQYAQLQVCIYFTDKHENVFYDFNVAVML